ncbi:hypothetical protein, partial [Streptomyces beigongshangae]|uniref:hypothetical protein n=1 Tax=Streptomyces beigongshangae TaxID=2841597 RepID=UPI001C84DCB7
MSQLGEFGSESVDDLGIDLISFGKFAVVLTQPSVRGFEVADFGLEVLERGRNSIDAFAGCFEFLSQVGVFVGED